MKFRFATIALYSFFVLTISCNKDQVLSSSNEDLTGVLPIWAKILSSTNDELNFGVLRGDIQYQGSVLLPKQYAEYKSLVMISSEDGEELWEWNDFYPLERQGAFISNTFQVDNILYFGMSERFYGLDLSNGQTTQKLTLPGFYIRSISGFDNTLLVSGYEENTSSGQRIPVVYRMNDETGELEKLFNVPQTYESTDRFNITGLIGSPERIISETGDDILCYAYSIRKINETGDILFGAYNYTADTMLYTEKEILLDANFYANGPDLVSGTKIFFSPATSLICYEGQNGEKLWSTGFPDGFTFSGYIATQGKILANCEDTYLYALDEATGHELWKEKSSGTSSKMIAHNGVVYFVGGGDGLLHAFDIETGRHLWKIKSPHLELNSGAWFMSKVNVVPAENSTEKATVVVSSYIGAFGYEAIH
jgi:outer membrane protein assembly factor BamB